MISYHYCFYFLIFNTTTLEEKFYHINDDLLVKYLLREATAGEEETVKQWLAADKSNDAYFNQLKQVWETSRQLAAISTVDTNAAWERFQKRIHGKQESASVTPRSLFTPLRIAASIILLLGIGLLVYLLTTPKASVQEMLVQTEQNIIIDTLPDGSMVTLNKRSSIRYPSRFKGDQRSVALQGEAFFKVTPDKAKPFVITVNDVQVTVVGTSFNVKAENGVTEVVVETGIVRVTRAGKTVELKANEKTRLGADSTAAKEKVSDHLYNYYRTKEFVCDDTPLWKLVEVLNEAYDVNIVIDRPELRELKLNTTFNNESLDQVLNVVSLTFDIKVTKTAEGIFLQ